MSRIRKRISSPRQFAIAYRIFTMLGELPVRSADCAEKLSLSESLVKQVVTVLGQLGCISTQRGGGKNSGIRKFPGVTNHDLFGKFNVPYREGVEFETEIDSLLGKFISRPKICTVCNNRVSKLNRDWLCEPCVALNAPLYQEKRMAKCGHYSTTRYFKCEECEPVLNDNTTPDDLGYGVSLLGG